jgi:hypothetical protein
MNTNNNVKTQRINAERKTVTVRMVQTRATQNTFVFSEIDENNNILEQRDGLVGTLYIKQNTLRAAGIDPKMIELQITTTTKY